VSNATAPQTIRAMIAAAAGHLAATGVPSPAREAQLLWGAVMGTSGGDAWLHQEAVATPGEAARFRRAVARRVRGEPPAYAAGSAAFRRLELRVDSRVLIPRPETEGLVQLVLDWATAQGRTGPVADVGTGSGCIALSLAVEGAFQRVVATDISRHAIRVASANLERVRATGMAVAPVDLRLGAFFAPLDGERFDAVVANPPYLTAAEFETLDPSVRRYEPREALVSGHTGLEHLATLAREGRRYLTAGGLLAVEIDARRVGESLALTRAQGWGRVGVQEDLFGRPRFLLAIR
jgi:release factor glutamine methyltransferase